MASINSKKLLPPSKQSKEVFLVPAQSILPSKPNVNKLKPVDEKGSSSGYDEDLKIIKKKVIKITDLIKNNLLLDKKSTERKRKQTQREKSEEREKKLEEKDLTGNKLGTSLISKVPGIGLFDRILRFAGFTLLGFIANNYAKYIPQLINFFDKLKPAFETFEYFAKGLVDNSIKFIEFGYNTYDKINKVIDDIGGKDAAKAFDDFSGTLNKYLNYLLIMGMTFRTPKRPPGGGAGSGFLAGLATGLGLSRGRGLKNLARTGVTSRILSRIPTSTGIPTRQRVPSGRVPVGVGGGSSGGSATRSSTRASQLKRGVTRVTEIIGPKGSYMEYTNAPTRMERLLSEGATRRGKAASDAARDMKASEGYSDLAKAIKNPPTGKGMRWKGRLKLATKAAKFPIIGSIIDLAISTLIFKEPLDSALVRSLGSSLGGFLGGIAGTFIPIPGAGTIIGATIGSAIGDWIASSLYETLKQGSSPTPSHAQGGQVSRGGRRTSGAISRTVARAPKVKPKIVPPKPKPGQNVTGGRDAIERLYTEKGLSALETTSSNVAEIKAPLAVNTLMSASVNLAMGQKPTQNLYKQIGDTFGSAISNLIDIESNKTIGSISSSLAMANGGVVPPRTFKGGMSLGERIGKLVADTLRNSIESSANQILQSLNMSIMGKYGTLPSMGDPYAQGPDVFHGAGAERMWNFFRNKGLSEIAVAGILGNARWESSFNPRARGKGMGPGGSDALGLFQWGETARWASLVKWAQSKNLDPWDFDTQLMFAWHEMQTSEKETIPALQGAGSAAEAAEIFRSVYERSAHTEQRRKDAAEGYYGQYKGKIYTPPSIVRARTAANMLAAGYKPLVPGFFNAVQYITGDRNHANFEESGHGLPNNYHDHIAFATLEDKERAKKALRAAGIRIGSEYRPGDPGYHGSNLAIDIPGYQWGGSGSIGQIEFNGSARVRKILGLDGGLNPIQSPKNQPTPSPLYQWNQSSLPKGLNVYTDVTNNNNMIAILPVREYVSV